MAERIVTGIEDIDRRLNALATREANQCVRSALQSGLTLTKNLIAREIDAESNISPDLAKALKATLGKRLVTRAKNAASVAAKAGMGVGKRTTSSRAKAAAKDAGRKGKPGVGISANNVHWFALGTANRYQGLKKVRVAGGKERRTVRTGNAIRFVGKIQPVRAVARAAQHIDQVKQLIEQKVREKLEQAENRLRSS